MKLHFRYNDDIIQFFWIKSPYIYISCKSSCTSAVPKTFLNGNVCELLISDHRLKVYCRPHPFTNWENQQIHAHPKNQELHIESDGPFAWRKGVRKLTTCEQGVEKTKGSQAYKVRLLRKMHYPQLKKRKLGGLSQQHCFPSCIYFLR